MSCFRARLLAVVVCMLGCSALAFAAEPKIEFEKQPGPLGNPPTKGWLEFKLKWSDCTNAQKLEVQMYVDGNPPQVVAGTMLNPIPGGANGSITMSLGSPSAMGKKGFIRARVLNNAGGVIAQETSANVDVP